YDAAMYALPYDDPIRKVLHAFKFGGSPYLAGPLAQLGEETLAPWLARRKGALVAPVPLHWRRLYWRGYNHSYLLAKRLAGKAGLRVEEGVLARIRNTDAQIGLNARQRGENVKGAFAVMAPAQVAGRDVVLFDDIITTGATVRECCKELWKAKPNSVAVAALCKTWD
ncbi:MAG: ComF family protein, partial [Nitrospinota bacterium]|nr:ComF family protein [Nitrospinota bacterium]